MPGETDLHKHLKKEACRWLFRMGYRCIAAEVRLRPLGIIDAVGTGIFRAYGSPPKPLILVLGGTSSERMEHPGAEVSEVTHAAGPP